MTEHEPDDGTDEEEVQAPRSVRPPSATPQPPDPSQPPQLPEPPPTQRLGSADLPPPPEVPSFAEQLGTPAAPPPAAPPPAAPPPADMVGGLAGPEFTAKRGTPMTNEEMLREQQGAGDDESGPRPPAPPVGPIEPVAKEFIVGTPGVAGVGFLKGLQLRRMLVGLVAIAVLAWGFMQLMPKGAEGEAVAMKFAQGQTNRYRVFVVFDGTRVLPPKGKQQTGEQQTFHTTMGATVDTEVTAVDATGATIDVTLSNFALHTGTAAFNVVPDTIHTQMHVDGTGAVTSGGLGLSAAVASKIIPGWDVLIPPLPPGAVLPGAKWTSSTNSAFAGSDTVPVSADSTLISFVAAGSQRMAVVTSQMVIPVDKTISIQSMADALGADLADVGFPEGSDTQIVYKGQIGLDSLARIDVASGQIFSNYTRGTATYTESITGWPPTLPEQPSGEVSTTLTFSMSLKQQPPGETPAKPKKSPDAKSSPTPNGAG